MQLHVYVGMRFVCGVCCGGSYVCVHVVCMCICTYGCVLSPVAGRMCTHACGCIVAGCIVWYICVHVMCTCACECAICVVSAMVDHVCVCCVDSVSGAHACLLVGRGVEL